MQWQPLSPCTVGHYQLSHQQICLQCDCWVTSESVFFCMWSTYAGLPSATSAVGFRLREEGFETTTVITLAVAV